MKIEELTEVISTIYHILHEERRELFAGLSPCFYAEWINLRFREPNKDPFPHYSPQDSYEQEHADFFVGIYKAYRDTPWIADAVKEGAARFFTSLSPCSEKPEIINNAIYLLGMTKVRNKKSTARLVRLIREETLLKNTRPTNEFKGEVSLTSMEDHREALHTLACIQHPRCGEYKGIWDRWFNWNECPNKYPWVFMPAAFSGLAMSRKKIPSNELLEMLSRYKETRKIDNQRDYKLRITPAILALWVDRGEDRESIGKDLLTCIQKSKTPAEDWNIILGCAGKSWPYLNSFKIDSEDRLNQRRLKCQKA